VVCDTVVARSMATKMWKLSGGYIQQSVGLMKKCKVVCGNTKQMCRYVRLAAVVSQLLW
jgi:hypothetical protein